MLKHTPRAAEAIAADRARYEEHQRKGLNAAPQALPAPSPRPAPAPEGVIPVVALDVRRAVALGLVPEAPARAAVIVADLASLRGAAP